MNPTLEFQRYECKYLVPELTAVELQRAFAGYIQPDEHAAKHADHSYSIASLYLDSADLRLHHETQGGQRTRYKLRIRTYGDDPADPVFFEIKRRHNAIITKSRVMLPRPAMAEFFAGRLDPATLSPRDQGCMAEFATRLVELHARPVVIVRYRRQAYVGALEPGVRVTFDRMICCAPSEEAVVRHGGDGWIPVEDRRVVVELKFRGAMPGWMQDAVHRFELRRTSYSKYSNSVLACGMDRFVTTAPQARLQA
ncbi:MAG TPA: polyphosphate polymerase domain-containing protein [Planctomycetota bacterium]|nr:polyphosphate polymerase domain-containing protein [Planctomycetota bacterium]